MDDHWLARESTIRGLWIAFVVALMIVVYLHVVLGEMVPKNIAIAGPEQSALVLGPPMMALVTVLSPVIRALNAIANATLRLLRVEPKDEVSSAYTREEVAALVEESRGEGMLAEEEYGRLTGALGDSKISCASAFLPVGLGLNSGRRVTCDTRSDRTPRTFWRGVPSFA